MIDIRVSDRPCQCQLDISTDSNKNPEIGQHSLCDPKFHQSFSLQFARGVSRKTPEPHRIGTIYLSRYGRPYPQCIGVSAELSGPHLKRQRAPNWSTETTIDHHEPLHRAETMWQSRGTLKKAHLRKQLLHVLTDCTQVRLGIFVNYQMYYLR